VPGQKPARAPTPAPVRASTGVATSPLMAKIEKRRAEIAALGDKLIKLGEDRDLARQQVEVANKKVADAQAAVVLAQQEAVAAAANAMRQQAALPPGALGS